MSNVSYGSFLYKNLTSVKLVKMVENIHLCIFPLCNLRETIEVIKFGQ